MKKLITSVALILLTGWSSALYARVVLPESGYVAGPLSTFGTELGEKVEIFPEILAPFPRGGLALSGWIKIEFDVPDGDFVDFVLDYDTIGSDGAFVFGKGQLYFFRDNFARPLAAVNRGRLNLETGEIVEIHVHTGFQNEVTEEIGRYNRHDPLVIASFPRDDFGVTLPPVLPGDEYADASFTYDSEGNITGFDFRGQTNFPIGPWAVNEDLGYYPPFSFTEGAEVFLANPDTCLVPLPPVLCPTDADNPDGVLSPLATSFRPHYFMRSNELREVPAEHRIAPCAPEAREGGVLVAAGGKLYFIGGATADGKLSRHVDIYDPATNAWSAGPDMPTPVYRAQAAEINGSIYVAGGRRSMNGSATTHLQILDPAAGAWSTGADAPRPVAQGGAVAYGDILYVFLGLTNRINGSPAGNLTFNLALSAYDPAQNFWLDFDIPLPLEGFATVTVGPDHYMIGGVTEGNQPLPFTPFFDLRALGLGGISPPRLPIYNSAAGLLGNKLFIAGGQNFPGSPTSVRAEAMELGRTTPVLDVFARSFFSPALLTPVGVVNGAGAVLGGEFFLVGGRAVGTFIGPPGTVTSAVQQFHPGRGWATCSSMPVFGPDDVYGTSNLIIGPQLLSPGEQASIVGANFADTTEDATALATVPTTLNGISVSVDGMPAPVLAVSPTRVDFQVPYGATSGVAEIAVTKDGSPQQAPAVHANVADASPGIFVQSCGRVRTQFSLFEAYALACNEDGTLNYAKNAAQPGEEITIQMTGLGGIDTALGNGERAPAAPAVSSVLTPSVQVTAADGSLIDATVVSSALAAGEVGIYDVTIELPANVQVGNRVLVVASVGGVASNVGAISVGNAQDDVPLPCLRDTDLDFRACLPEFTPIKPFQ